MPLEKEKTLILSGDDVIRIVERFGIDQLMDSLIERLTSAVLHFDKSKTEIPIRSGFNYQTENPGLIEWMPVYKKGKEVVIKVVGYHPQNPDHFNLPTILSSISSYDTKTGHLKGIADGVLLTALRTGAASAVASRVLAKPESTVLGLIGCGAQAVTQLHALSRVFQLSEVLIYDSDPKSMDTFANRMESLDIHTKIKPASIQDIIANSDIVCTETSIDIGVGPLFEYQTSKSHLHINAVGSDFPGKTELPVALLRNSFVCPDFYDQAKIEGECQQLKDDEIDSDWVEVLQNASEFKQVKDQLTVFDSTGWALEDQVVMDLFLDLAKKFDIGLEVAIENVSEDAKNPYHFLTKTVEV